MIKKVFKVLDSDLLDQLNVSDEYQWFHELPVTDKPVDKMNVHNDHLPNVNHRHHQDHLRGKALVNGQWYGINMLLTKMLCK